MNIPVAQKVALYPIASIVLTLAVGILGILVIPAASERVVSDRVTIASTLFTGVTLQFLISERLDEAASRKLEFLNKRALTPILTTSRTSVVMVTKYHVKSLSEGYDVLKRRGRFLLVRLYPKCLLESIDNAKYSMEGYDALYERITAAGVKDFGQTVFNIYVLFVIYGVTDNPNYTKEIIERYNQFLESLKKTEPGLGEDFDKSCKAIASSLSKIRERVESFFDENQLEEVKPSLPYTQPYS